jgi:outer membrane protein OmpA-like peptidoglycan-associated protein
MRNKFLQNSTALAVVLAMSLPAQISPTFAQQAEVDCTADPENAACAAQAAPVVEEAAPAVEEVAPAEGAPVEQPSAEEAAPAAEEAPAVEEAPAAEEAPAVQPAAEEAAPAEAAPAAEEAPAAEAAPAEQPAAEQPEAEQSAEEQPAAEQPATEEPAPAAEEVAPAEASPAEQPAAEQPEAEKPAAEQPAAEQPATEEAAPAAEEAAPAEAAPAEQPAAEQAAPAQPAESATEEPGEPIETEATAAPEVPASVVPDDITDSQRQQLQVVEQERRDDSRKRRLELLGAAAVGVAVGALIPALGGKVVEDQGDRIIVERDGEYYVRKDESSLLRYGDAEVRVERLRQGRTREIITRQNGVQIITIRDQGGYVLYRSRVMPDGREFVMIDNREFDDRRVIDYDRTLPPLRVGIPRERYIVPARGADYDVIYETFLAPPVEEVEQAYSLREVRENRRIRDKVRRVDLDSITFDTGSATVRQSQVPSLEAIARASAALIEQDPSAVLLIEGHTDAVGSDVSNLTLSDRRAETVARILAEVYEVPAENMVVQGYGEQYLKVDTDGPSEENRRVTIRNITQLLSQN